MFTVQVKPLSANEAYTGRRYKTDKYKQYYKDVMLLLPKRLTIPEGKLELYLEWGVSNSGLDIDNPVKQTQDTLSKAYGFNDNRIYAGHQLKTIVPKGQEYFKFSIKEYRQ
jgi:Holliday junction resolvase RusA-like endonuclease